MKLPILINIDFQGVSYTFQASSGSYPTSLKCAIDLESWFRIKYCQHVENHHYTTNVRNDVMKLTILLNIDSQSFPYAFRSSSGSYPTYLKCAIDLESWFLLKCCQYVKNHHYSTNIRNEIIKLPILLNIDFQSFSYVLRYLSGSYPTSLKCAIDLESWFRIKCCQHVKNHHYTTNVRNDAMKLPILLNIDFQSFPYVLRYLSGSYPTSLKCVIDLESWFRIKCCQHVENHH